MRVRGHNASRRFPQKQCLVFCNMVIVHDRERTHESDELEYSHRTPHTTRHNKATSSSNHIPYLDSADRCSGRPRRRSIGRHEHVTQRRSNGGGRT